MVAKRSNWGPASLQEVWDLPRGHIVSDKELNILTTCDPNMIHGDFEIQSEVQT